MAATVLIFIAFYQIADDTQAVAAGTLRGYKDTSVPMVYGMVGYWLIALPLGAALANGWFGTSAYGVYGYWAGLTVGLGLVAIALGARLVRTSAHPERIMRFAAR